MNIFFALLIGQRLNGHSVLRINKLFEMCNEDIFSILKIFK